MSLKQTMLAKEEFVTATCSYKCEAFTVKETCAILTLLVTLLKIVLTQKAGVHETNHAS